MIISARLVEAFGMLARNLLGTQDSRRTLVGICLENSPDQPCAELSRPNGGLIESFGCSIEFF